MPQTLPTGLDQTLGNPYSMDTIAKSAAAPPAPAPPQAAPADRFPTMENMEIYPLGGDHTAERQMLMKYFDSAPPVKGSPDARTSFWKAKMDLGKIVDLKDPQARVKAVLDAYPDRAEGYPDTEMATEYLGRLIHSATTPNDWRQVSIDNAFKLAKQLLTQPSVSQVGAPGPPPSAVSEE